MSVHSLFSPGSFDPETAALLATALDAAWDVVVKSGSPLAAADRAPFIREQLAKRIIESANTGERDKARLVEDAIAYLAARG
jgi:hypothetical protein